MPFGIDIFGTTASAIRALIPGADTIASAAGALTVDVKKKVVAEAEERAQAFFMQKVLPIVIILIVIAYFAGRSSNGERNA